MDDGLNVSSLSSSSAAAAASSSLSLSSSWVLDPSLWSQQPISILARGYEDGTVQLSCPSSLPLSSSSDDPTTWMVRDPKVTTTTTTTAPTPASPVVAVSWDATGTYLAAIDSMGGGCCFWELRYSPSSRRRVVDDHNNNNNDEGGALGTSLSRGDLRQPAVSTAALPPQTGPLFRNHDTFDRPTAWTQRTNEWE